MRPRVFPAEDNARRVAQHRSAARFNEAAGIPRGRPGIGNLRLVREVASMRPRVFPAEDKRTDAYRRTRPEASMRPRVFPAEDPPRSPPVTRARQVLQ